MTKTQFVMLAILFITTQAIAQFAFQYIAPHKLPMEWEYRTYYLSPRDDGRLYGSDLSEVGADGWELVQVVGTSGKDRICLFKRPVFGPLRSEPEESSDKTEK